MRRAINSAVIVLLVLYLLVSVVSGALIVLPLITDFYY